ncbi:UNVERIFIED_CONTAM: hypothetical protein Scaly_0359300 [Sesamum calycinum]|uniref:Protein TIC 100 n=1 Tax=Sesamum calycinum TaxID=2727403 RepID=A0AAW2SD36_9LAMI
MSSTRAEEDARPEPKNAAEEDSESEATPAESSSSSSESDSDSDLGSDSDSDEEPVPYIRPDGRGQEPKPQDFEDENTPEANISRFSKILFSKRMRRELEEEEQEIENHEDLFDFPRDPENWREEDLKELWADAPLEMTKPGWDPNWVDEEEVDIISEEIKAGRDPPIAPFYVPYRKPYPAIPNNHHDISNPKAVIEELDRIEEFLRWVSYIFPDGSTYEGTVWDDLAHGKGVYVAEQGLVRYEGEWLQNNMEGHGVVEVEIPTMEPIPGSKLEAKMRAEGKIISRDFMSPEDREWLEMDIEDSVRLANGEYEIPFYENDEWIRQFGKKPEKGRYRYAGQWKHGRMHGCGVYELNEQTIYGRFYFGELLGDPTGCDAEVSALHAGIAEVAAAKARMFINKPDGMVREYMGPYSDPQHPYFYEEEDVWMAPGFINQFYEVPDYWKMYVHEVDQEREMWLNSFYKAPLRLPMPSELEYWWWSKDEKPEFVLLNKEPEPDPEDPSKLVYNEDPLILHTPTGRIINYVDDEEHGIRLFWQPPVKEGDVDPDKAEFLPLEEEEKKVEQEVEEEDIPMSAPANQLQQTPAEVDEEEEDEEEEDDTTPSSFGSIDDQNSASNDEKGSKFGKSTFAASSLSFANANLISLVPLQLQNSFIRWSKGKFQKRPSSSILPNQFQHLSSKRQDFTTVSFSRAAGKSLKLRCTRQIPHVQHIPKLSSRSHSKKKASMESGQHQRLKHSVLSFCILVSDNSVFAELICMIVAHTISSNANCNVLKLASAKDVPTLVVVSKSWKT